MTPIQIIYIGFLAGLVGTVAVLLAEQYLSQSNQ